MPHTSTTSDPKNGRIDLYVAAVAIVAVGLTCLVYVLSDDVVPPSEGIYVAIFCAALFLSESRAWFRFGDGSQVTPGWAFAFSIVRFPSSVFRALNQATLDPTRLELEITESALASEPERSLYVTSAMREAGVRVSGALLMALGTALNLAAIAMNGGTMPASEAAWHAAGLPAMTGGFENSNVQRGARFPWLGDVFAIPKGWPLANVFSIGDVLVVIAIGYFAHAWCRRPADVAPHGVTTFAA